MAWRKPIIEKPITESPKITPLNPEVVIPRKAIVPEFIKIEKMSIRYIQPYPAPDFIKFFQSLNHEDVDFVRIPVDKKNDVLYLRKSISKLLQTLTGIHWDKIEILITKYNADTDSTVRNALLCIMDLATYFADKDNIEFLREPTP